MAAAYILTIFTSAFLIFLVQPMLAKLMLPFLGGTSSVWNTSMVFYQLLLLGGYLYAHLGLRFLGAKRQSILHVTLLIISLVTLPLALNVNIDIMATEQPIWWLISVLFVSIGLPFFLLSANAPLLQSWFAHTTHKNAHNPYFLYSASNLGSFIALIGYPFVFAPFFDVQQQMGGWSILYIIFTALIIVCAVILRKNYRNIDTIKNIKSADNYGDKPQLLRKAHWVALAFIPSSLMLGVTTYITTDIASVPLLWIIPLALYLLTFVFAFSGNTAIYERSLNGQVSLVLLIALLLAFGSSVFAPILAVHIFMFFAVSMVCHGQLAKLKPSTKHLTEFFLWISVGGVLGGMFNALLAPAIFDSILEYQIILVISCFFRPLIGVYKNTKKEKYLDFTLPLLLLAGLTTIFVAYNYATDMFAESIKQINTQLQAVYKPTTIKTMLFALFMIVFTLICYKSHRRPIRFGLTICALLITAPLITKNTDANTLYVERNFFGVMHVNHYPEKNHNALIHGTTLHGTQSLGDNRLTPASYYGGPLKQVFASLDQSLGNKPTAVVGLGAGTIACYGKKNQTFNFYEIDKSIENIARNTDYFTYLSDCPPNSNVIIGDGRIKIEKAENKTYGLIILDAFSSDSIPIHLITSEALTIYLDKLREGGLIGFHISNRHINLAPVLASLVQEKNLAAVIKTGEANGELIIKSQWVVLAKDMSQLGALRNKYGWQKLEKSDLNPWTDDYSNILQVMF